MKLDDEGKQQLIEQLTEFITNSNVWNLEMRMGHRFVSYDGIHETAVPTGVVSITFEAQRVRDKEDWKL